MRKKGLSCLFGYAGASYFFLKHPDLLHVKNMKTAELMKQDKVLFAHRGGSIENPENTLQAFKAASKLGTVIETDVRCTKDGKVLICHDVSFKRLTSFDAKVSEISLDQVPKRYAKTISIDFGHHNYKVKPSD